MSLPRKPAKPREPLNEAGLYDYSVRALGRRMRRVPHPCRVFVFAARVG
jgi:hypothetical protein